MQRIALIEDNPDNRLLLCTLLEDDYLVDEYEDGPSALAAIGERLPALILLDISLPGMDGTEVLRRLKASPYAKIPTVAITAHAMDGDREHFLNLGFDGYLSKPIVDENELLGLISGLLAKHE